MSADHLFPPNRCFDCLAPIGRDETLCETCTQGYRAVASGDTESREGQP